MRVSQILAVAATLALVACGQTGYFRAFPPEAPPPAPPQMRAGIASDSIEYSRFGKSGTATISGQAFLTTRGGDVKRAAGRTVLLDPVTEYATAWMAHTGPRIDRYTEDPGYFPFHDARRTTKADADGRFTFSNLAAGDYYVTSAVSWEIPSTYSTSTQGGVLRTRVTVKAGEAQSVILNSVVD